MQTHVDLAHTANLLGVLGTLVQDRVDEAVAQGQGPGPGDAAAIITLGTRAHGSIDALGRTLGLSHSATVRRVDRLVDLGLARRKPGHDGRSKALELTRQGQRAYARLLERRQSALEQLLTEAPPGIYEALRLTLPEFLDGVAETRGEAQRLCRSCDHAVCRPCPVGHGVHESGTNA